MNNSFIDSRPIDLVAGETISINILAEFILFKDAEAAFEFNIDNDGFMPGEAGVKRRLNPGEQMKSLSLKSSIDQTVIIVFGSADYWDSKVLATIQGTVTVQSPELTISYGLQRVTNATVAFANKRSICVQNNGTTDLTVGGDTLKPGEGAAWSAEGDNSKLETKSVIVPLNGLGVVNFTNF